MRHFIAYNNDEEWGEFSRNHDYKSMWWYSNKSEEFLRESLDQFVWMVSGEGKSPKAFYLHGYYVPSDILPDETCDGFRVFGEDVHFTPTPIYLNNFVWFQQLKKAAGRFAFGFSEIRDDKVIQALQRTTEKKVATLKVESRPRKQQNYGAGFGDAEQNKQVEVRAVAAVTTLLIKQGWAVESVESEYLGYDLRCQKRNLVRHIEVKGVSGNAEKFILTANEMEAAQDDEFFELYVVLEALSDHPKVQGYSSKEFLAKFSWEPKDYFVKKE